MNNSDSLVLKFFSNDRSPARIPVRFHLQRLSSFPSCCPPDQQIEFVGKECQMEEEEDDCDSEC